MISPIGTWLTRMDANVLAAINQFMPGLVTFNQWPFAAAATIFFAVQGMRVAKGDHQPLDHLMTDISKIFVIGAICTQIGNIQTYVVNLLYVQIPGAMMIAAAGQDGVAPGLGSGVQATAAAIDKIWAQMWVAVSHVWSVAGITDVSSRLAAGLCALSVGGCLAMMAFVYLISRVILGVVLGFAPTALSSLVNRSTSGLFERWIGKVISLTFLEVAGIIVLQMLMTVDQEYMNQISAQIAAEPNGITWGDVGHFFTDNITTTPQAPAAAGEVEGLISMVVWFGLGAFAMYSLPAIAYSLGTGVSVSLTPAIIGAVAAARGLGAALDAIPGSGGSTLPPAPNYSLGMTYGALSNEGDVSYLPPPPPPSLSSSTTPLRGS